LQSVYNQNRGSRSNYQVQAFSNVQMTLDEVPMNESFYDEFEEDSPNIAFSNQEDLFFYTLESISLNKGSRAYFDLLEVESPLEHIYKASLSLNKDTPISVMHNLKLKNNGKTPWTTAFVTDEKTGTLQPINQDMLKYTPPGGEMYLEITKSPEIQVSQSQVEVERKEDHKKIKGYYYDLITIKGSINIKNYKKQTIKIELNKMITGQFKNSTPSISDENLVETTNINPTNKIEWTLEVDSGKEEKIEYLYEFLRRR